MRLLPYLCLILPLTAWAATIRLGVGAVRDARGRSVSVARLEGRTNAILFAIGGPKEPFTIFLDGREAHALAQSLEHPATPVHRVVSGALVDIRLTAGGEVSLKAGRAPESASALLTAQSAHQLASFLERAAEQTHRQNP